MLLVVLSVSADPQGDDNLGLVGDANCETVVVAADVEDHHVRRQEAGRSVSVLDVMRRPPLAASHVCNPGAYPASTIRVVIAKLL